MFRLISIGLACGFLAPLVGCNSEGGGGGEYGTLKGVVTFKGDPLPGGTMTIYVETDKGLRTASAQIDADGTFVARKVPVGPARVTVETDTLRPLPGAEQPQGGGKRFVEIPKDYANKDTTELRHTVAPGEQEVTFPLS